MQTVSDAYCTTFHFHLDDTANVLMDLWKQYDISYSYYIRSADHIYDAWCILITGGFAD